MQTIIAHPIKIVGRIVLVPRQVRNGYARIVSTADGSGRIELFDAKSNVWSDASGGCTFGELWSAAPSFDQKYFSGV